jgi:hypothetical protein
MQVKVVKLHSSNTEIKKEYAETYPHVVLLRKNIPKVYCYLYETRLFVDFNFL